MGNENAFEDDFRLLDRYQKYSAELVRISLLGVAGVGALYTIKLGEAPRGVALPWAKWSFIVALCLLGLATTAALLHRFYSTDFMACLIRSKRLEAAGKLPEARLEAVALHRAGRVSIWCIWLGAVLLALGAIFLVAGFAGIVFMA